jgi:C-type mannose receptor
MNCNSKYGSYLVAIGNRYQQYWINEQFLATGEATWIGLKYVAATGKYDWGTTNEKVNFDHWDRGNPRLTSGECVSMNAPTGFWANENCTKKQARYFYRSVFLTLLRLLKKLFPSICMTYNQLYTTVATTTVAPLKCLLQWTEADGRCFRLFKDKQLNWFEAEAFCKKLAPNGHLASFASQSILNTVTYQQYITYNTAVWIGLNRLDNQDGGYRWIDGRPVQFLSWDAGQPNDLNGVEDCVEMTSFGKWTDRSCYTNKGWFCTIDKGVVPANVTDIDVQNETFPSNFPFS